MNHFNIFNEKAVEQRDVAKYFDSSEQCSDASTGWLHIQGKCLEHSSSLNKGCISENILYLSQTLERGEFLDVLMGNKQFMAKISSKPYKIFCSYKDKFMLT